MTPRDLALRAYRASVRPLNRCLVRWRDCRRLRRFLLEHLESEARAVFVIVLPNTRGWLDPCLKLVPPEVPLVLIANGLSSADSRALASRYPSRPLFRLTTLPGTYTKHGTALDVIVGAATGDFVLLDHDCYVFESTLLEPIEWQGDEFVATVEAPGFETLNEASGLRFPRTHFLAVRRELILDMMARHRVGCEKALTTPRRLAPLLAAIGIGDQNFPPVHMAFFDTMQLLMSVAFAEGLTVRRLPVRDGGILHVGGTARARNQPGVS